MKKKYTKPEIKLSKMPKFVLSPIDIQFDNLLTKGTCNECGCVDVCCNVADYCSCYGISTRICKY